MSGIPYPVWKVSIPPFIIQIINKTIPVQIRQRSISIAWEEILECGSKMKYSFPC